MRKCGCGVVMEKMKSFKMFLVEEGEGDNMTFNQWHRFSQGEYFARKAATLMGRRGKIVSFHLLCCHFCLEIVLGVSLCCFSLSIYGAGVALKFYAAGLHGLDECNEICYKDPVLKDRQWTAYIDRSPGSASYSEECFKACKAGCGYKFEIHPVEVDKARPNRPCNSLPSEKPPPVQKPPPQAVKHGEPTEDVPCTSA
ncbi:hypothetical protein DKX38_005546 [Salix brachista]|uniref:Uncharacterized protein n=1 Tax=Salix brachista TaxID=2182728 RepID=A0A5N5N034_9ROSI|nr:hypothetical protein DKX38_005546 [Salix brachista]